MSNLSHLFSSIHPRPPHPPRQNLCWYSRWVRLQAFIVSLYIRTYFIFLAFSGISG